MKERKEIKDHLEAGRKAAEQQLWLKLFSGDISPNREEICRYIADTSLISRWIQAVSSDDGIYEDAE